MPTVSFEQIGVWVACALIALDVFFRYAAYSQGKRTASEGTSVSISSQPLEVKHHEALTPLAKHQALEKRVDGIEGEMDERIAGLSSAGSESRDKIYAQLRQHGEALARNTEKTDLTYAHLQNLDSKMDRVLERLPRHSS